MVVTAFGLTQEGWILRGFKKAGFSAAVKSEPNSRGLSALCCPARSAGAKEPTACAEQGQEPAQEPTGAPPSRPDDGKLRALAYVAGRFGFGLGGNSLAAGAGAGGALMNHEMTDRCEPLYAASVTCMVFPLSRIAPLPWLVPPPAHTTGSGGAADLPPSTVEEAPSQTNQASL
jgi:hypothetical protein